MISFRVRDDAEQVQGTGVPGLPRQNAAAGGAGLVGAPFRKRLDRLPQADVRLQARVNGNGSVGRPASSHPVHRATLRLERDGNAIAYDKSWLPRNVSV